MSPKTTAREAIGLADKLELDLAIVAVWMADISGISLAAELAERRSQCRVLGLSMIEEPCVVADMLRARACGFVFKSQPTDELVDAIREVVRGRRYVPPAVKDAVESMLAREAHHTDRQLTPREREIFELLIRGLRTDEIAQKLFISPRTVETHKHRVMNKVSAHSIMQIRQVAARCGLLSR